MTLALSEEQQGEALELFRALLRLDTTNPPGNERAACELLAERLVKAGVEPRIIERTKGRGNLVARVKGDGSLPPLLLNAHLDVVPADAAAWTHPPFAGEIHDGWVWGRGAVDMKHMAAMSCAVVEALARMRVPLARDVIFAAVADEEAGSRQGALWLADEHKDLVRAEYALGEIGGFTLRLAGRRFYPIQVAQKGVAWMRMRTRGTPGHGSIPRRDNATVRLARAVARLGARRLPRHPTEPLVQFVQNVAGGLPAPLVSALLRALPLGLIDGTSFGRTFAALLSNTATPTVLRAGTVANVVPAEAEAIVDGRTLPGQTAADLMREVRAIAGEEVELALENEQAPLAFPAAGPLYECLEGVIRDLDPGARAIPFMIPGFTDAYAFAKLGTTYFGFAPLQFPQGSPPYADLYHGHDERAPVEGFRWGARALFEVVRRFCARAG